MFHIPASPHHIGDLIKQADGRPPPCLASRQDLGEPTLHTTANGTVLGTRLDIPLPKEDDVLKMRFWTDEEAMDWLMALMR